MTLGNHFDFLQSLIDVFGFSLNGLMIKVPDLLENLVHNKTFLDVYFI